MRNPLSSSSPSSTSSTAAAPLEQIPLPETYEAPAITTYTEAELLNALGMAHAGSYEDVENWLELP